MSVCLQLQLGRGPGQPREERRCGELGRGSISRSLGVWPCVSFSFLWARQAEAGGRGGRGRGRQAGIRALLSARPAGPAVTCTHLSLFPPLFLSPFSQTVVTGNTAPPSAHSLVCADASFPRITSQALPPAPCVRYVATPAQTPPTVFRRYRLRRRIPLFALIKSVRTDLIGLQTYIPPTERPPLLHPSPPLPPGTLLESQYGCG